jgi:TonB-dependent SusC/RagA subfamily outer membrane receptor
MNGPQGLLLILNYIYIMEKMKNLFVMFFLLFLFVYSLPVEAQGNRGKPVTIDVKGTVVSVEDGLPVVGATVLVEGTEVGTATDNDGKFVLNGVSSDAKIRFSYIGMISQVLNAQSTMLVKLATDTELLEEVVVTGIFERKKEGFTGSANRMEGDEIRKLTSGNVLVAIQALDPGFRMGDNILSGSNPNSIPEFNMRGQSSMGDYSTDETVIMRGDIDTRPNQPLFVLDGIIDVGVTKILDLDPAQIESITLLKDAAAMAIYGSQASNGVVVVETKAPMAGKLRVSYNGNYKVEYPDLTDYDLLNAAEKLELEKRAGYYDAIGNTQNQVNRYNSYRWKLLEIQRGVNSYWIECLINDHGKLSKLVITRDYRIVLPDYNNMEISMTPIVKAVYLLFLRHPEGINYKDLVDYRDELTSIYVDIKGAPLDAKMEQSVVRATNPLDNSINEKVARIREAFVTRFDEHLATNYIVHGGRGEAKRIPLHRELVEWQ